MKKFDQQAAQGDVFFLRVASVPEGAIPLKADDNGQHVVAHSETGHNHVMKADNVDFFQAANDPMVMFLVVKDEPAVLEHLRDFDTHEPMQFDPGIYEIHRQKEWEQTGERPALD